MQVENGPKDPEEKRNFSFWWFVISGLLFICAIWAIFDESVSRRPWKKYERAFNRLELSKLTQSKKDEEQSIKDGHGAELEELNKAIKQALDSRKSAAYSNAVRARDKKEKIYKDKEQQRAFAKADKDEAEYLLDHAQFEGDGASTQKSLQQRIEKLVVRLNKASDELSKAESEFKAADEAQHALDQEYEEAVKKREKIFANLNTIKRNIDGVHDRTIEIKQTVVNGLGDFGRVDRCETCHMGIQRPGFEDAPQPFTTHPKKDVLFAAHPPDQFGCTSCHHGQGRALTEYKAHTYEYKTHHGKKEIEHLEHWLEPMYRGPFMQSACNDCHGTSYRIKEADVYTHGNRLFIELGCHGCHMVDGYDTLKKVAPDLKRIASKTNPEWLVGWIKDPNAYNPHTRMPNFRFKDDEAVAVASYLWSQSDKNYRFAEGYPGRGGVEAGKELVNTIGCRGCHVVEDNERAAYDDFRAKDFNDPAVRDHGPQLTRIAEKTTPEWIYNWIRNPKHYNPGTRMPSLRLADWEARNITSYLLSLGKPLAADEALRQKFADPEQIKRGEGIIRKRGCYGCHDISGFENADRIAPELTKFGVKDLNEIFFGHTLDKNAADKVADNWEDWTRHKLRKPNVFDTERVEHLMPTFTWRNDDEITALLVFLKSLDGVKVKEPWAAKKDQHYLDIDQGQRLVDFYSCNACHLIENRGGTIRSTTPKDANGNVIDSLAPPNLKSVGAKIQSGWLFRFLHQPTPVRPWLKIRMPSFNLSDQEFTAIVRYFAALDRVDEPFQDYRGMKIDPAAAQRGQALFSSDQCTRCHVLGETSKNASDAELASKAPNLRLAHERLRPNWIVDWLADPNALVPGTRMPAFWDVTTSAKTQEIEEIKKEIAASDSNDVKTKDQAEIDGILKQREAAKEQMRCLRDYILTLTK